MPRNIDYRELKKRLIKEYPIFVAGVLDQANEENSFDDDNTSYNTSNRGRQTRRGKGRVISQDDRRLKQNRGR